MASTSVGTRGYTRIRYSEGTQARSGNGRSLKCQVSDDRPVQLHGPIGLAILCSMARLGKYVGPILFAALLTVGARPAAAFDFLAGLGSNNFAVSNSLTTAPYSQTATNLTLNAPFDSGVFLRGGFSTTYDWTSVSSFGLVMSAPGASPNQPFTIEFLDPFDQIINAYSGFAENLSNSASVVQLNLATPGTGDLSAVADMFFTWDGGGTAPVELAGIVPEPSTWALLGFGALFIGFCWCRSRRRA